MAGPLFPGPFEIKGSAVFGRERTLRLEIRRWWVPEPKRWAAWLMLNPSVAGENRNDPTAQRVTHFTRAWGYDGWIGVNLYPFISSKPAEMWRWANWQNHGPAWDVRDDLLSNRARIEEVARQAAMRVVAFGARPVFHDEAWLDLCLEAFSQPSDVGGDETLYCLGTNTMNQPLHPMARGRWRIPNNVQPAPWSPNGVGQVIAGRLEEAAEPGHCPECGAPAGTPTADCATCTEEVFPSVDGLVN
jgi:hypothetical protein